MTVLYLTATYPYGPPGEAFLEAELASLASMGADVLVAPIRRTGSSRTVPDGIKTLSTSFRAGPILFHGLLIMASHPLASLRILSKFFGSRHLIKNFSVAPLAFFLAYRSKRDGITHIHAHWLSTPSTVAWIVSQLTGIPFSITCHRWDIYDNNLGGLKASDAAFVRFISERGRADFKELTGAEESKLTVLHMGVPTQQISMESDCSLRRAAFEVVSVGHLIPVKGHRYLVEAMGRLPADVDARLRIFGEGPLRAELIALAHSLGIAERVEVCGGIAHSDLMSRYNAGLVDCVVLPSLNLGNGVHEGIPVSLMEAMAASVCVVSTATGSISELVTDDESGLLVADKDSDALAYALASVARDPELRSRLAGRGAEVIRNSYDSHVLATQLNKLWSLHGPLGGKRALSRTHMGWRRKM